MRRFFSRHPFALAALLVVLGAGALSATTNTYSHRDASGVLRTFLSFVCGSSSCSAFVPVDSSGTEIIPATQATSAAILAKLPTNTAPIQATGGTVGLVAGSAVVGKVDHAATGIGHGFKTSTSVGTAVAIASSTAAKFVTLQAYRSNTGYVAIGATGVNASLTAGTGTGLNLAAGESTTVPIDNLADVFIDVTVSGEGVRYTYGN